MNEQPVNAQIKSPVKINVARNFCHCLHVWFYSILLDNLSYYNPFSLRYRIVSIFASMNFLFPAFLAALGVIIIPILLHLFHLRRFKTFYFSNLAFIKALEVKSKSARKIKNLLILLSRILALVFLVLAFAQPFLKQEETDVSGKQEVRIIFIDNSYSLSALGVEGELLSQARSMAKDLISKDPIGSKFLVLSNFFAGEEMRLLGQADALDYIDALPMAPFPKKADAVYNRLEDLMTQLNIRGELFVLSDGQVNQWQPERALSLSYPIRFVQLKPESNTNLTVDSIWTNVPVMRPGAPFDLSVRIRNNNPTAISTATMALQMNDNKQMVNVEFNGERTKTLNLSYITPKTAGFYAIEAEIEDNQIHFDDELSAAFQVSENMRTGIINGPEAGKNVEFVYSLDSYYQMEIWPQSQVNLNAVGNSQLLVLNQLSQIDGGLKQRVINNIQEGKAVVFVPHPKSDLNSWNELLSELQLPVLQKADSGTIFINKLQIENSFFDGLFDSPNPKIQIPVKRKTRLLASGSRSMPLMSFSDGSPFLCKSSNPSWNVFLFNADLNKTNANLLTSDLFSTLFLRIGEMAGSIQPLFAFIGESAELEFKVDNYNAERPARLVKDQQEFIPRQEYDNGILKLILSGKSEELMLNAGYFDVVSDNNKIGIAALNFPRIESDLSYFEPEVFSRVMREMGVENFTVDQVSESYEIQKIPSKLQTGLWRIFLLIALLFFLIEMVLVKFWR